MKYSSVAFDVTPCLLIVLWRADEKEKYYEKITRIKKKMIEIIPLGTAMQWEARSITEMDYSVGQKNQLNSSCALCSDVS